VCFEWRAIAMTMRDKVFGENDAQLIDIHDIKAHQNTLIVIIVIMLVYVLSVKVSI
jgi:hypothetical protein